tara:strand:+ start:2074 stop:3078 length:1005 start_codon:yes stop_codon:yes gene_type:complete
MKKISIIGGSGFIGHNLALLLKNEGFEVSVIDDLEINNLGSVKRNENKLPFPKLSTFILNQRINLFKSNDINLIKVDAKDHKKIHEVLNKIKPNIIVHLAAVSHANRSNVEPHKTFENSLVTLENVLDYAKKNIDHFIFSSSSMVYGNFKTNEVNEDSICSPIGIYGAMKYSAEKIIQSYNQAFNLPFTIIRPSALYGERCISRRVGQIFIENALNNKEIIVDGDGEEKLDFTYIQDLLDGILRIIKIDNSKNQIFNITYGSSRKINDLIKILGNHFDNLKVSYKKRDKLMPIRGTLSTKKAKKILGFNSSWPIEKGYVEYIRWYKKIFNSLDF